MADPKQTAMKSPMNWVMYRTIHHLSFMITDLYTVMSVTNYLGELLNHSGPVNTRDQTRETTESME